MIYFGLLALNILLLFIIKSDIKYWIISIPLWIFLISGFIYWRTSNDKQIEFLETQYWKSAEGKGYGNHELWTRLDKSKKKEQKQNGIFINIIVLQTFVTFIIQIVGQKNTNQKKYKWTKFIFGVLSILAFLLIAMMGIVPTGGYVT